MYTLQRYSGPASRFTCPECNARRTFTRYVNIETGEEIAPHVGKCARDNKCGYHFKPRQYFQKEGKFVAHGLSLAAKKKAGKTPLPTAGHEPSTINHELFKQGLKSYNENHFITYCAGLFGDDIAAKLVEDYLIGTSKHWPGATIFWQIDKSGNIRTGKIMLYDKANGKRVKKPFNHITWVHSLVGSKQLAVGGREKLAVGGEQLPGYLGSGTAASCKPATANFTLRQCFFGEHLLALPGNNDKPVAIVESEKTALIAGVYLPHFVWLAAGSLQNISVDKCDVLKGRNVILFPDLNAYGLWSQKVIELRLSFKVSNLLEHAATDAERLEGLDLADYLLKFNYADFTANKPPAAGMPGPPLPIITSDKPLVVKEIRQSTWGQRLPLWDVDELQRYFDNIKLPCAPVKLNACTTIANLPLFVTGHLEMVRHNNGKPGFLPYLKRLKALRALPGLVD